MSSAFKENSLTLSASQTETDSFESINLWTPNIDVLVNLKPYTKKNNSTHMLSCLSRVQLFATLWTIACQAALSMEFSQQEYWSGLSCPPRDLPDPGIKPRSLMSPALAGSLSVARPREPHMIKYLMTKSFCNTDNNIQKYLLSHI